MYAAKELFKNEQLPKVNKILETFWNSLHRLLQSLAAVTSYCMSVSYKGVYVIAWKLINILNHLNTTQFPGTAMYSRNVHAVEWK